MSRSNRLILSFCTAASVLMGILWAALPVKGDSFDWRDIDGDNWNSSIKSQFGGTCWAFGSMGTVEAHYMLTRNDFSFQPDVSEQQIVWETSPDMGSTGGGMEMDALHYVTTHGVVSETECPYQESSPDVGIAPYWPLASGWQNRVWKNVGDGAVSSTTANIKAKLKTNGPLLTAIMSSSDLYSSVNEMRTNFRGPVSGIDHAVIIVGYYDDPTIQSGGYWVIKNSWDVGFGDSGYGYVPYGDLENHHRTEAINGATYYTGSMADATWKGGSNTWSLSGNNWTNNADDSTYAWENKETTATFNAAAGTAITLAGPVITHGMTINSGAIGYTFTGGSLTVTSAGITANESATFDTSIYVGAPQTWNIAGGKTLTIGSLHTIISNLTLNGNGNTTITGSIDGGGVINIYGGAAPGAITKDGNGTLFLTGAATYSTPLAVAAGTLNFAQSGGDTGNFSGVISGGGAVTKTNSGTIILSGNNTYTSSTTVFDGALQADSGTGLPSGSFLILNGGVIQSNGATTFTRRLATSGTNRFELAGSGGGFSAGAGPMTVNIGNDLRTLTWGNTVGTNIVGTLKFGSLSTANVTTLRNPVNISGADPLDSSYRQLEFLRRLRCHLGSYFQQFGHLRHPENRQRTLGAGGQQHVQRPHHDLRRRFAGGFRHGHSRPPLP